MKKLLYIFTLIILCSCDSESANSCFKTIGTMIQKEIVISDFDKVLVNRDIELIIKEGTEYKLIIETGANLINDVEAAVLDGKLILTNHNSCNYVRDYGVTKVYITAPNITEIRSSTQYDVHSDGVLTYPSLTVLAEDYNMPGSFTSGNFRLQIDNENFSVVFNNLSNCFVSGKTNNLNVTFASGTSRFEGANLIAEKVVFWNRSSNDMNVNPQQSIVGTILGSGNIISVTHPPIVDVSQLYKGRLIFN